MENLNSSVKQPQYLALLSVLCVTFWIVCLAAQDRLVSLSYFGYVTATIFAYPFVCSILDIIAEVYGYKAARRTLWSALASLYIFALSMFFFAKLPAPLFWDAYANSFNATMHPMFRVILVGSLSIIIGQYINIYMMSKLYFLMNGRFFALRSISSTIVGDTVTFALSLWGYFVGSMTIHEIFVIVIDELVIMYGMAILLSIPATVIVSVLKKREPVHQGMNFNPFK